MCPRAVKSSWKPSSPKELYPPIHGLNGVAIAKVDIEGVRTSDIKDNEVLRPRNRAGTIVPVVAQLNAQAQSRK